MIEHPLLVIGAFVLVYGLVSSRLERSIVTPPMVFVAFGMIACPRVLGLLHVSLDDEWIHLVAEFTLVLVLFIDASRVNLRTLRKGFSIPLRLLLFGLPLTIVAGGIAAVGFFPDWMVWEALLLAAILAPTDAALGQAVVSHPKIPIRIRQALNVESGLNDGMVLPLVLLFAGCAAAAHGGGHSEEPWLIFTAKQLTFGPLVGVALGIGGGGLIHWGRQHERVNEVFQRLGEIAIALLAFQGAEAVGGNGFIAAFVAGIAFGNVYPVERKHLHIFFETGTQFLVLLSFILYGALMVWPSIEQLGPMAWVYGILSLTLVRLIPTLIALAGSGLNPWSKVFIGWFGPRGLASILFGLLVLGEFKTPHHDEIFAVVSLTVLMSVVLHGLSALPGAEVYARYIKKVKKTDSDPEHTHVTEQPLRKLY